MVDIEALKDFEIFKIQDPANRVDYYLFDHGWNIKFEE